MPVTVAFNGSAQFKTMVRNTGNIAHTFYVGLTLYDPTGRGVDLAPASVNVSPGQEAEAVIDVSELNIAGNWDAILAVHEGYDANTNLMTGQRFHDTGRLTAVITVSESPVTPTLSASIVSVKINESPVYP